MAQPLVSVVIATLNRDKPLCGTIDYFLSRETYRPFEIIVIDQSEQHDAATTEFLKNVTTMIDYQRPKYKNVGRARNDGIASAKGEIIVFVDDDVEPFAGFIDGHVAPYVDKNVWGVTGPSISPGERLLSKTEIRPERYARLCAEEPCFRAGFDYSPCSWGPTCNLSIRKTAAELIGGFDQNFAGTIGDDSEFCHRIKKHGGVIYYAAQAALVHLQAPSGGTRSPVKDGYVMNYAHDTNYFWRAVGGSLGTRLGANWRVYRNLVMNKPNLEKLSMSAQARLHRAFVMGAYRGWRRPLSRHRD